MAKAKTRVIWGVPITWKRLFIAGSVALNIGFVVIWIAMMTTGALDRLLIDKGFERYCYAYNDGLYENSTDEIKALREFTCARNEAAPYFQTALTEYMNDYNIGTGN